MRSARGRGRRARPGRRSRPTCLPLVGVLIGLAAASKWVGFYALAGLFVLVLARSALGRLVLVAMVALIFAVGAIGAPWPFLIVMLGLLAIALAITWVRPIGIDVGEAMTALPATAAVLTGVGLAFVIGFGQVQGAREPGNAIEYLFGLLARGAQVGWPVWLMIGIAAALVIWRAVLSLLRPESDARWFRPGEMGGFACGPAVAPRRRGRSSSRGSTPSRGATGRSRERPVTCARSPG